MRKSLKATLAFKLEDASCERAGLHLNGRAPTDGKAGVDERENRQNHDDDVEEPLLSFFGGNEYFILRFAVFAEYLPMGNLPAGTDLVVMVRVRTQRDSRL